MNDGDRPGNDENGPEKNGEGDGRTKPPVLSADFLLQNPTGVSLALSSFFLIIGVVYNLGLFAFIDTGLVSALPLTEHISTSISISLTLVPLILLLCISSVLLMVALWAALRFALAGWFYALHCLDWSRKRLARTGTEQATGAQPDDNGATGERAPLDRLGDIVSGINDWLDSFGDKHTVFIYAVSCNLVMYLIVYFLAVPTQLREVYEIYPFVLGLVGVSALIFYLLGTPRIKDDPLLNSIHRFLDRTKIYRIVGNKETFRPVGFVILFFLIPFQLGVFQTAYGFSYIYNPKHSRPYTINKYREAHLLRAGNNGIFFAIKTSDRKNPGSVRFEPWNKVDRLEYRLRQPR